MELDLRGLSCPQPALKTLKALAENPGPFALLTDSAAAAEHIGQVAASEGRRAELRRQGPDYLVAVAAAAAE